jgi:hypothetical protein
LGWPGHRLTQIFLSSYAKLISLPVFFFKFDLINPLDLLVRSIREVGKSFKTTNLHLKTNYIFNGNKKCVWDIFRKYLERKKKQVWGIKPKKNKIKWIYFNRFFFCPRWRQGKKIFQIIKKICPYLEEQVLIIILKTL